MNKAVFFDRDGVINKRIVGGYTSKWSQFHFLPQTAETLAAVKEKGYLAIIITNQRGVGTGIMTERELELLHQQMQESLLQTAGVQFDDIYACTDADDRSTRRKPSPAMIFEAAKKWDIDLAQSWMIGDAATDIEAGIRAGTMTAFVLNDHENIPVPPNDATILLKNVFDIVKHL